MMEKVEKRNKQRTPERRTPWPPPPVELVFFAGDAGWASRLEPAFPIRHNATKLGAALRICCGEFAASAIDLNLATQKFVGM
jgi:hypothetical protein